jgi:hypothetical protein
MKRLLILLCVVLFLAALPMSHLAFAGKPEEKPAKVLVCHITGLNEAGTRLVGHVIDISENALPAHCAHGDHNPVNPDKVKGDPCSRRLVGAVALCDGERPVPPPWYEQPED